MKKMLAVVLAITLSLGLFAAAGAEAQVTLNFMFNSPELIDAYNALVAAYEEANPNVKIELEVLQNDYQTVLKSRLNAGETPDLFLTSAYNDNKVFGEYAHNLNEEAFIKAVDPGVLTAVTYEGNVTGLPFLVQSHSFIYNIDLFEQAGVTELPATLDQLRACCEKLRTAGIQPFSTGFSEWWILPQTTYPCMADAYDGDYEKLFEDVKSGALKFGDLPQVEFAMDVLDLIREFGGEKPMESTNDVQCSEFANGKVAMIHNGNWAEASILAINPDIRMGYVYHPTLGGKAALAVESNLTFRVAKDSPNRGEVLNFLNFMCTSEYGKAWIPEQCAQISPLLGASSPASQLAAATAEAQNASETCPWWIFKGPDGIEQPFGVAFQNYAAGTATREETRQALTDLFVNAYAAE